MTFVRWSPDSWMISPISLSFVTAPLHWKFFLKALQMRLMSRSSASLRRESSMTENQERFVSSVSFSMLRSRPIR